MEGSPPAGHRRGTLTLTTPGTTRPPAEPGRAGSELKRLARSPEQRALWGRWADAHREVWGERAQRAARQLCPDVQAPPVSLQPRVKKAVTVPLMCVRAWGARTGVCSHAGPVSTCVGVGRLLPVTSELQTLVQAWPSAFLPAGAPVSRGARSAPAPSLFHGERPRPRSPPPQLQVRAHRGGGVEGSSGEEE